MNNLNESQAINLNKVVRHKIITSDCKDEFEKQLNDLVSCGWQPANIQTEQVWSEVSDCFKYSYQAIFVKQGI